MQKYNYPGFDCEVITSVEQAKEMSARLLSRIKATLAVSVNSLKVPYGAVYLSRVEMSMRRPLYTSSVALRHGYDLDKHKWLGLRREQIGKKKCAQNPISTELL